MKEYILFGDKETFKDYGLLIQSLIISEAEPKEEIIDIMGNDGELDFSKSLTGDVKYKNRKISINLAKRKNDNCFNEYSKIQNDLHGETMKIIFSKDPSFYYQGKVKVKEFNRFSLLHSIDIECNVEPYKYEINASNENWLWDPFNFENGIINETKNIEVNRAKEVVIYGRRKRVVPYITCQNTMQVIFNSKTYNLLKGKQKVLNIEICEGKNVLKFIGTGIVDIEYRGGSL